MSYRSNHRKPTILRALIKQKGAGWNKTTRELAPVDGQRVLEALVAEVGVEGAKEALKKQGFEAGAYEYLLQPLYEEAQARRLAAAAWTDDGE